MRFGAPLFDKWDSPNGWIKILRSKGYNAAYCPLGLDAPDAEIAEYVQAARENDILISEVGAWGNNPLHPDKAVADAGYAGLVRALAFADKIGARCCVNVVGSCGQRWDGPHPANLTRETYDRIIDYTGRLLDEVKPQKTGFCFEMMPWMFPTTADEMLRMIGDVDRAGFEAHVDLVNITCSPRLYFENAENTKMSFKKLGGHIKGVHAKDITLSDDLTVHLSEVRAGLGYFDYKVLLSCVQEHCPESPVMLEHLQTAQDYDLAAEYVRGVANSMKIAIPLPERD